MSDFAYTVAVDVPATSANLGPGFDCLGLALDLTDTVEAGFWDGPDTVEVHGEGADVLPTDASHLVLRVAREAMGDAPADGRGIRMRCTNRIPQARGLGSSAAAIVAGVVVGRVLGGRSVDPDVLVAHATDYEGHPDNVAPAVLGGFTTAWMADGRGLAVRSRPHRRVRAIAIVPDSPVSTHDARKVLPDFVPRADAIFNVSRAALLVRAMVDDPQLLLTATADTLHQEYRRGVYPDSLGIVDSLRAQGIPAFISGAGPTVLALVDMAEEAETLRSAHRATAVFEAEAEVRILEFSEGIRLRV